MYAGAIAKRIAMKTLTERQNHGIGALRERKK